MEIITAKRKNGTFTQDIFYNFARSSDFVNSLKPSRKQEICTAILLEKSWYKRNVNNFVLHLCSKIYSNFYTFHWVILKNQDNNKVRSFPVALTKIKQP